MTTKRTLGLRDLRARVGQLDAIIRQLEAEKAKAYAKWQEERPTYGAGGLPVVYCSSCRANMKEMILQLTTREEPKKRYRLRKK